MTATGGTDVVLSITSPPEAAELLSALLFDHGCRGIQVTGSSPEWTALAYFAEKNVFPALEVTLERQILEFLDRLGVSGNVVIERKRVKQEDWERRWRESLKPFRVGRRIVVRPSFCEYGKRGDDIVITMDPRMAFGSGHHETTRLSLLSLERLVGTGNSLLDAGAGTGILSIAAAGLGASDILAVEMDPVAYENCIENLAINGLDDRVETLLAPLADVPAKEFDIIVANIDREAILTNMSVLSKRLRPGGRAILTGFLSRDVPEIEKRMLESGLISVSHESMGEWALLEGALDSSAGAFLP